MRKELFFLTGRRKLIDLMLGRCHVELKVFPDVFISGWRNLTLGDHVSINRGCHLTCEGGLRIGDYVSIGHRTSIISTEHQYADESVPIKYQPLEARPVTIGSNVWIGAGATILGGVSIANGSVVAAGAVVTTSVVEEGTIVGGVPARFLKHRVSVGPNGS